MERVRIDPLGDSLLRLSPGQDLADPKPQHLLMGIIQDTNF